MRQVRQPERLADFSTNARVVTISLMALVIGILSAFVALALLRLIGLFTNLFFSQRWDTALVSPVGNQLGILVVLVPVIGGCQALTVRDVAARSRELVERARSGRISERELSGGTFTISNLGMYGIEEFMAVIHPPQGAILAVGAIMDEVVVRDGQVTAGRMMRMTLSADHRLLDGAYGAKFLQELKRVLENPVVMLV